MKITPVILCGGTGSRLWPSSRKSHLKQFINFFNNRSLLDLTFERCKEVFDEQPLIISSYEYKHCFKNHTDKPIIIIETQVGSYFSEDDIVRIDYPYNR